MGQAKRLLVVLPDPLRTYAEKGEIKPRYYNPAQVFDEVHFVSFCEEEADAASVQSVVGEAKLVTHPVGPWTAANLPSVLHRVRSVARKVSPQVVRTYSPFVSGVGAVMSGRSVGCPVVVSVHNDFDHQRRVDPRLKLRLARFSERYTLSRATRVICVTRALVAYARRYGARDIEVIYNRVDSGQFSATRDRQSGTPQRILTVGRLVPQKDHACLLKAIVGLDVELTIIGSGPLEPSLKALVSQLGLNERVRFIPAVPHSEIQRYYAEADLFAIATRYEGFCIPVLEAMASGLPVVASAIPPIEEVLGGTGCTVEHKPAAFREALCRLMENPSEYAKCHQEGLRRARELDGAQMEKKEAALYTALMEVC